MIQGIRVYEVTLQNVNQTGLLVKRDGTWYRAHKNKLVL